MPTSNRSPTGTSTGTGVQSPAFRNATSYRANCSAPSPSSTITQRTRGADPAEPDPDAPDAPDASEAARAARRNGPCTTSATVSSQPPPIRNTRPPLLFVPLLTRTSPQGSWLMDDSGK